MRLSGALAMAALLAGGAAAAAERTVPIGNFDRVLVGGSMHVTVDTGGNPGVRAEGDAADLDKLDIAVRNGALEIGTRTVMGAPLRLDGPVRIAVSVPALRSAEMAGPGSLSVDYGRAATFIGKVAGSGDLRIAAVEAKSVVLSSAGSGSVYVAGRCTEARLETAGSGSIRAAGLRCDTLKADTVGSGDISGYAAVSAAVTITGSGDVSVAGGGKCTLSRIGSGSLHCP